ncbi:Chemotaxis protein methyltransferase [compost metagenome]
MSEGARKLEGAALRTLLSLVKEHTGITMEERKKDLLVSRIRRRLRVLGLETPEQYVDYLQATTEETQEFVNAVTTNETLFFRTPVIWEYFKKDFLPEWFKQNSGHTLRVWSAASSSGEEAHSLAMLCEDFKLTHPSFRYRIYGSDISTEVLNEAKSGVFKGRSIEELKTKFPDHFVKYFRAVSEGSYKASDVLAQQMEFTVHNLHHRPPKNQFYDIVFLRNVMIYFNDRDQELVLQNIHRSMKNEAILILGESESLARLKTPFLFKKPLIYQKGS